MENKRLKIIPIKKELYSRADSTPSATIKNGIITSNNGGGNGGGSDMEKYATKEELKDLANEMKINQVKIDSRFDRIDIQFDGIDKKIDDLSNSTNNKLNDLSLSTGEKLENLSDSIMDKIELSLLRREDEQRKEAKETRRYIFGTLILGAISIGLAIASLLVQ